MARGPTEPRGKRAGARFCVCPRCVREWDFVCPRRVSDLTLTRPRGFRDASPSCPRRVLVGSWSCPFPVPSGTRPVQDTSRTGPRHVHSYRYLRSTRWGSSPSWRRGGIRRCAKMSNSSASRLVKCRTYLHMLVQHAVQCCVPSALRVRQCAGSNVLMN